MKGPNPFSAWEEAPEGMIGRKEELRIFGDFAGATASKQPGVILVRGGPGIGKTSLLRHLKNEAEGKGMLAPYAKAERGEDEGALADKLQQDALAGAAGGGMPPLTFGRLAEAIDRLAGRRHFGAVIFIDDIDLMRKPEAAFSDMIGAVAAMQGRRGVSFVVSSTKGLKAPAGRAVVMELPPFSEHDAREMVEKALKKGPPKMGDECLHTMMADTGGNPRLLRTVCKHVYDRLRENEKVITKGHYLAYLPHVMGMLSREWFGGMYQESPPSERAILRVLAKREEGMHVSDIAKELGKPMGPVTALIKRLLERGQITRLDRGKYRIFSRLYGKYVISRES